MSGPNFPDPNGSRHKNKNIKKSFLTLKTLFYSVLYPFPCPNSLSISLSISLSKTKNYFFLIGMIKSNVLGNKYAIFENFRKNSFPFHFPVQTGKWKGKGNRNREREREMERGCFLINLGGISLKNN